MRYFKQIEISCETLVSAKSLLPLLNAQCSFPMFDKDKTDIRAFALPFFENVVLVEAQSFSCIPPVTLQFLVSLTTKNAKIYTKDTTILCEPCENNFVNFVVKIDGTRDCIFNNLDKLGLILNEKTAIQYVKFVLDSVWSEKGSLRLTESYDEIDFSENPTAEQTEFLRKNIRPATFCKDKKTTIDAIIIFGADVFQAKIELQNSGIFEIVSETLLCENYRCLMPIILE